MAIVDELEEDPVFGFNTYLVAGVETETLPTGSATYEGFTVASVFNNDALVFEDFVGSVFVEASFDSSLVDIALDGASVESPSITYTLAGTDLAIVGSQYDGPITGTGIGIPVTGDLFGAFYGSDAEATAGVFGAEGSADGDNIDIVGAFGAAGVLFVP